MWARDPEAWPSTARPWHRNAKPLVVCPLFQSSRRVVHVERLARRLDRHRFWDQQHGRRACGGRPPGRGHPLRPWRTTPQRLRVGAVLLGGPAGQPAPRPKAARGRSSSFSKAATSTASSSRSRPLRRAPASTPRRCSGSASSSRIFWRRSCGRWRAMAATNSASRRPTSRSAAPCASPAAIPTRRWRCSATAPRSSASAPATRAMSTSLSARRSPSPAGWSATPPCWLRISAAAPAISR